MESFAETQKDSDNEALDNTEMVAITARFDATFIKRVDQFASETVRTRGHAMKFLMLKGFEALEKEMVNI